MFDFKDKLFYAPDDDDSGGDDNPNSSGDLAGLVESENDAETAPFKSSWITDDIMWMIADGQDALPCTWNQIFAAMKAHRLILVYNQDTANSILSHAVVSECNMGHGTYNVLVGSQTFSCDSADGYPQVSNEHAFNGAETK